ncbi:hypothetical protein [Candidatus Palauibacter sp.]|uniref:hypothetical protein n=1 Tax=Candidatus Palauibacter sp. TaxID=3101350 RepID=UPI003CC63C12
MGEYDRTYWEFPASEGALFKTWISAEVWADDRLEAAMNIDRNTLRDVHPAYVELRGVLHRFLSAFLKDVRRELYGAGAADRQARKAEGELLRIKRVTTERISPNSEAGRSVSQTWLDAASSDTGSRSLTRKYSVSELYDIVLGVADEVLPKKLLGDFIRRLTERLRK